MRDAAGNENTLLSGNDGNLWLGGKTADGDIMLFANGEDNNRNVATATIHLNGDNGRVRSRSLIAQERKRKNWGEPRRGGGRASSGWRWEARELLPVSVHR